MSDKLFHHFLFSESGDEKDSFTSVCDYGIFPINQPMNVDDYKLKPRKGFLDHLAKQYETIKTNGEKYLIDDVHDVSPKLFLRDILTEYVVKNIFKSETLYQLIHIMNRIMTKLYDQFHKETGIRLYFVYRGGNILKLYKTNLEEILPGQARKFLKKEFDEYFKNSDIDFYTVVEGALSMTKEELFTVNSYIQMMCFYGTYIARIFIMNNFHLFNFCNLNEVSLKEEFQELIQKMNEDKSESEFEEIKKTSFVGLGFNKFMFLKDPFDMEKIINLPPNKIFSEFIHNTDDIGVFETYKKFGKSGRTDVNITPLTEELVEINPISYDQKNLFQENFVPLMNDLLDKNQILDFYITNNNKIFNKEEYMDFSLVRLMINFTVVYKRGNRFGMTNAPSELYDLSIGHPEDKMYDVYTEKGIIPYTFTYDKENDKKDTIYIPSIETTILDLIKILFEYRDFPWEDPKYNKRLFRLLILVFFQELSRSSLQDLRKKILSKKKRMYTNKFDTTFETLLYRNDVIKQKIKPANKKEYKEYTERYKDIQKKLVEIVDRLIQFMNLHQLLSKKDIAQLSKE